MKGMVLSCLFFFFLGGGKWVATMSYCEWLCFCLGGAALGQNWWTGFWNTVLSSSADLWPWGSGSSYWTWGFCHQVSITCSEDTES